MKGCKMAIHSNSCIRNGLYTKAQPSVVLCIASCCVEGLAVLLNVVLFASPRQAISRGNMPSGCAETCPEAYHRSLA